MRLFSFDAGLCQFLLTSRYSTSYFQVQCFLLPSTVFFTSKYSVFYFQVQCFFNFSPIPYSDRHLYSTTLEVLRILQPSKRVHFVLQEYRIPGPYNKQSMVLCPHFRLHFPPERCYHTQGLAVYIEDLIYHKNISMLLLLLLIYLPPAFLQYIPDFLLSVISVLIVRQVLQ